MTKSIHDEMSRSEVKTFAELVRKKGCKLPLTEHEQSRYLELREEYNSGIGPEQRESWRERLRLLPEPRFGRSRVKSCSRAF